MEMDIEKITSICSVVPAVDPVCKYMQCVSVSFEDGMMMLNMTVTTVIIL